MSQTRQVKVSGESLTDWCNYWRECNTQYLKDNVGIDNTVRSDLAEAARVMSLMARMLDAVEPGEFEDAKFHDVDGMNWFDLREAITGKKVK